jgi:hypothetical protein
VLVSLGIVITCHSKGQMQIVLSEEYGADARSGIRAKLESRLCNIPEGQHLFFHAKRSNRAVPSASFGRRPVPIVEFYNSMASADSEDCVARSARRDFCLKNFGSGVVAFSL